GHLQNLSTSAEAADLAKQLLAWDASDRISLEAALEHPFLAPASSGSQSLLSAQDLCNRLDRFVDSCRLQQLAQTAIAHMLGECRKDGALARATFVELERLGDGEATTIALSHFLQMHGIQPTAEWLAKVDRHFIGENARMSYTSFLAAALDHAGITGDHRLKSTLFDLLDSDGDGLISIEDLRSGLNLSLEDSTEVISEALGELRRKGKKETSGSITFWNFL
ncbi:Calcium-dependent protein kinase 5 (PfCDPK5), partial [Durusdinium trenchii]